MQWIFSLVTLLLIACHPQAPLEIERRVPVDVVGDCVILRQRLSECQREFAQLLLDRRAAGSPELSQRLRDPVQFQEARTQAIADLSREADLSSEDRRQQCRIATAETPPPRPEDVAHLHRCLALPCDARIKCLRPMLLAHGAEPKKGG